MKACWELSLPVVILTKSSSPTLIVTSADDSCTHTERLAHTEVYRAFREQGGRDTRNQDVWLWLASILMHETRLVLRTLSP